MSGTKKTSNIPKAAPRQGPKGPRGAKRSRSVPPQGNELKGSLDPPGTPPGLINRISTPAFSRVVDGKELVSWAQGQNIGGMVEQLLEAGLRTVEELAALTDEDVLAFSTRCRRLTPATVVVFGSR